MTLIRHIFNLIFLISTAGLVSIAQANDTTLTLDHAADVFTPSGDGLGQSTPYLPNTEMKLSSEKIYWIQAKGKVPILVIPHVPEHTSSVTKVQMPEVKAWPSALTEQEINSKLGELLEQVSRFQYAVRQKDIQQAERILAVIESQSNADYIHFLRATLNFVKGDLNAARSSVKRGLQRYPSNEPGQQLLKALGEPTP